MGRNKSPHMCLPEQTDIMREAKGSFPAWLMDERALALVPLNIEFPATRPDDGVATQSTLTESGYLQDGSSAAAHDVSPSLADIISEQGSVDTYWLSTLEADALHSGSSTETTQPQSVASSTRQTRGRTTSSARVNKRKAVPEMNVAIAPGMPKRRFFESAERVYIGADGQIRSIQDQIRS